MLSSEDLRLIQYNVEVVKNVMRDIEKYDKQWLSTKESHDIMRYNTYINAYSVFIGQIYATRDFYELYNLLYSTSCIALWQLMSCLDGLESLLYDITKSINNTSKDPVLCAHSLIRQNYILEELYSASWNLLSCKRDSILKLLEQVQNKIEFLELPHIMYLDVYLSKVLYKCRLIKDICPNRILGYNLQ